FTRSPALNSAGGETITRSPTLRPETISISSPLNEFTHTDRTAHLSPSTTKSVAAVACRNSAFAGNADFGTSMFGLDPLRGRTTLTARPGINPPPPPIRLATYPSVLLAASATG